MVTGGADENRHRNHAAEPVEPAFRNTPPSVRKGFSDGIKVGVVFVVALFVLVVMLVVIFA